MARNTLGYDEWYLRVAETEVLSVKQLTGSLILNPVLLKIANCNIAAACKFYQNVLGLIQEEVTQCKRIVVKNEIIIKVCNVIKNVEVKKKWWALEYFEFNIFIDKSDA